MCAKLLAALLVSSAAVWAAPPKATTRIIRIPLWVDGRQPLDLAQLRSTAPGARVISVAGPSDELMLLVVFDLTGDLSLVAPAKDALIASIAKLPPQVWVGLMRAQDSLQVLADPTADRAGLTRIIQDLPASGNAGLLDTVETAEHVADAVLAKSAVRVAVLYITDSDIHNYREDYTNPVINSSDVHDLSRKFPESLIQEKIAKMQARMARCQAPLFIVHLRYMTGRLNEAYQAGLKVLADVTGGTSTFCRSSAEIDDAIAHMLDLIASHYSVTLAIPEHSRRSVQIQLDAADHRGLNYRTRFDLKEK